MHYKCPACSSMKKPKIKSYFPPVTVSCMDCGYEDREKNFIRFEKPKQLLIQ